MKIRASRSLLKLADRVQKEMKIFQVSADACRVQRGDACLLHTRDPSSDEVIHSRSTFDRHSSCSHCSEAPGLHSRSARAMPDHATSD